MSNLLLSWLTQNSLLPHGYCINWSLPLLSAYVVSDGLIALSYYAIPTALGYFAWRRKDLSEHRVILWLFAAFIIACGTTHLISIFLFWQPFYWLDAGFKVVTAVISVVTVIYLFPRIPVFLNMPSPGYLLQLNQALELEISRRKAVEAELRAEKQLSDDIIDSLPGAFYIVNEQGILTRWNGNLQSVSGYSAEEMQGKSALHFIADRDRGLISEKISECFETGNTLTNADLLTKNGDSIPHFFTAKRIVQNAQPFLIGLGLDFTEHQHLESELRRSEQKYRALFESSRDAIMMVDFEGGFTDGNPAAVKMFGFRDTDELIGATPALLSPEYQLDGSRSLDKQQALITRIVEEGSQFFEWLHRRQDGSEFVAEVHVMFVKIGQPMLYAVVRDISKRKQAESALRDKERMLSESQQISHVGSWVMDLATGHIDWSDETFRIYGVAPETFNHRADDLMALLHPDDRAAMSSWISDCMAGNSPPELDFRIIRPNGDLRYIAGRGGLQYDDQQNPVRITGVAQDITERKWMEEALRTAKFQAEESARVKTAFLANMSHEIRTPMNAILGFAQLASHREVRPKTRDYLDKIIGASQSLLQIIDDILDFSKAEAGRIALENAGFSLNGLLDMLRDLFTTRATQKGLTLEVTADPNIPNALIGDKYRLQQILANLLSNAIKFTRQGSVSLQVALKLRGYSQVRLVFSVQDTGIGMSEADRAQLFQPFSQADTSITRRFGGTGLGLAISRNLLHLMGGEFSVASIPSVGSTFSFELVLDLAAEAMSSNKTAEPYLSALTGLSGKLTGKRILIAEDSEVNQQVVAEFLQLSGADVICADNGREALESLDHGEFDAVLMDIHMPEMDGLAATRQIRQNPRHANLPVIALTAGIMPEEREKCFSNGMDAFIAKPIIPEQLFSVLCNTLRLDARLDEKQKIEVATQNGVFDHIPGFDLSSLNEMLGGQPDKICDLLYRFREDMSAIGAEIEACIESGDMDEAKSAIHTLKGSAGNVGATILHEAVAQLENDLLNGQLSSLVLNRFRKVLSETQASLTHLRKSTRPSEETAKTLDLEKSIAELEWLLSRNSFIDEAYLDRMAKLIPPDDAALFTQLYEQINSIQYNEARATLNQLKLKIHE